MISISKVPYAVCIAVNNRLQFGERSYDQEFQLVSCSFPLPYDGILGRDFLTVTDTVLDYENHNIAVFGSLIYPRNPTFSKEPEPVVLGKLQRKIINQWEVELSKLIKTDYLEIEQSEALGKLTRENNDVFNWKATLSSSHQ